MPDKDIFGDELPADQQKELDNYKQKALDYNELVYRVFSSEDGEQLMKTWVEQHLFSPTVVAGQPIEAHGIAEGKATFVRNIFETINLVENNYHQQEDNDNE